MGACVALIQTVSYESKHLRACLSILCVEKTFTYLTLVESSKSSKPLSVLGSKLCSPKHSHCLESSSTCLTATPLKCPPTFYLSVSGWQESHLGSHILCFPLVSPLAMDDNSGEEDREWNRVRVNRVDGLHLNASPATPTPQQHTSFTLHLSRVLGGAVWRHSEECGRPGFKFCFLGGQR